MENQKDCKVRKVGHRPPGGGVRCSAQIPRKALFYRIVVKVGYR